MSLKDDLEALFKQPPFAESAVAQKWGDAMTAYGPGVSPTSTAAAAAGAAIPASLTGFSEANQAASKLESAFATWGAAMAVGMTPYTSSPAVAPTGQVGFADVFANTSADAATRAQDLADKIDTWVKKGVGPDGSPANWSPP